MVKKKNGMIWRIRKVEKNEKIKWNGMGEMGYTNKWLATNTFRVRFSATNFTQLSVYFF